MRNFRASEQFKGLVDKLTQDNHPDAGRSIFPTMRELLCFAAILGFEHDRCHKLKEKTFEIVDGRIFSNSPKTLDIFYLISLASTKDSEILRDENENRMIEIFEEYSQGGFEILESWLREKPEDLYGDKAILTALYKYKFLNLPTDVEEATGEVSF